MPFYDEPPPLFSPTHIFPFPYYDNCQAIESIRRISARLFRNQKT